MADFSIEEFDRCSRGGSRGKGVTPKSGDELCQAQYECALCGADAEEKDNLCAPEMKKEEKLLPGRKKRRH